MTQYKDIQTKMVNLDVAGLRSKVLLASAKEFEISQILVSCLVSGTIDLYIEDSTRHSTEKGIAHTTNRYTIYNKLRIQGLTPTTRILPYYDSAARNFVLQQDHVPLYFCFKRPVSLYIELSGTGAKADIIYNIKIMPNKKQIYGAKKDKQKK
jgi:hypothetical protein